MLSYEITTLLSLLPIIICTNSFDLLAIINIQTNFCFALLFLPSFLCWWVSTLAETNRTPFDLPEAEAELVAGYNVEYSSITFALFFLSEYSNMLFASTLTVLLFSGCGNSFIFIIKILILSIFFVLIRSGLPRYRYDQLLATGWKVFLPIMLVYPVLVGSILLLFRAAPIPIDSFY
jgi:NADH-quinone oxidoreductase subunit H